MTNEEAIRFSAYAQIMSYGKPDVQEFYRLAEIAIRAQQKHTCPCDLCRYGPPSSMDGKPCTMCPAVPKHDQERNDPLTLDELRQMVGQPVYVTHRDGSGGRWGIVNLYTAGLCADVQSGMAYWFKDYTGTIAYRRKPEDGTI